MNITIDLRDLSVGKISGVQEYVLELSMALLRHDKKNAYAFYYNSHRVPLPEFFDDKKVFHTKWPTRFFNLFLKFFGMPKLDALTNADLFFSPMFLLTPLKNTPRILVIHDLAFLRFPEFFSRKMRFWFKWVDAKKQIRQADFLVVPSESAKNDLRELLGISEDKIIKIHHGIGEKFFKSVSEKELKDFKIKNHLPDKFILYLATIEPRKNILSVIAAAEKIFDEFSDMRLILAGNLGWLYKDVLTRAKKSKWRDKIIIFNNFNPDDRPKFYQSASVFVYPSFFEGFGFPPLEAQASGVPVVASNRSSLPEILGSSAILVNPHNVFEIAEGVEAILKNGDFRNYLIKRGTENASRFSWESASKKYQELFERFT